MLSFFTPQGPCTDAAVYLSLGHAAATTGTHWNNLRPIGAIQYFSIPYRLGLPPESIILANVALALLSSWLGYLALGSLTNHSLNRATRWLCVIVPALLFMAVPSGYALTDVPAASFALIGTWSLILAQRRPNGWVEFAGGLFLGLAVIFRIAYLNPVLATALVYVFYRLRQTSFPKSLMLAFVCGLLLTVGPQYYLTFMQTGHWSLVDRQIMSDSTAYELTSYLSKTAGIDFDTDCIASPRLYNTACVDASLSLKGAMESGDIAGLSCLFTKRQYFYFGSYEPGFIYYPDVLHKSLRTFSPAIAFVNVLLLAFSTIFVLVAKKDCRPILLVASLFVALNWATATIVHSEFRYMMVPHVWITTCGLAGAARILSGAVASGNRSRPAECR